MATSTKPAAKKAAAPAKAPVKKAAAPAKVPAKKPAAAKKPAEAKQAPAKRAATTRKAPIAADQRSHYIEVAAYYIAERHGFQPGRELEDWAAAEAEIDRLLAAGLLNP